MGSCQQILTKTGSKIASCTNLAAQERVFDSSGEIARKSDLKLVKASSAVDYSHSLIALVFAHKTRDAATAQKNPAFGGADRLFGCAARKTDLHPSNDSVWSRTALGSVEIQRELMIAEQA